MALSGKTLELDTITTETLYTRGIPLFSSVTYFPTYSSLSNGAYASWALLPLSTVFYSTFYGYSNFDWFTSNVLTISTNNTNVSTTLASMYSSVAFYSTSTMEVLQTFSNLPISTVSSFQAITSTYLTAANSNVSTLTHFSTVDEPGLSYWLTIDPPVFLSTNFDPNSNTIVGIGQNKYGYIPLPGHSNLTLAAALNYSNIDITYANSTIFRTTNGRSWAQTESPPLFFETTTLGYNGTYYLAGGLSTGIAGPTPALAISYDGQSWSTCGLSTNLGIGQEIGTPTTITWNGSIWLLGTAGQAINENILFSYDAFYWSTINYEPPFGIDYVAQQFQSVYSVGWNGTTFCVTGESTGSRPIIISPNGFDWYGNDVQTLGFNSGRKVYPYNGGWLVGGEASPAVGGGYAALLHMSSYTNSYTEWYTVLNKYTISGVTLNEVTAIAEHNSRLVVGLKINPDTTASMAYTDQIQEFASLTLIDFNASFFATVNDIQYTGSIWLAGGEFGMTQNTFAYSQDGANWTGDGFSTFSTYVRQFLTINFDPNQNAVGSNRIQDGVSSIISTLSYPVFVNAVDVTYPAILSNTSSSWGDYESTTRGTLSIMNFNLNVIPTFYDSGSTLLVLLNSTNTQLQSSISNQFFGNDASTFSSLFIQDFINFTVPELSSAVTTFSNRSRIQQVIYRDEMFSTYKTNGATAAIATFSNIASTQFIAASNNFSQFNGLPGLEILIQQNDTIIVPFLNILSVSTNQTGYVGLSTFAVSSLSSFSSLFPVILASSLFYNLGVLNSNISSLSTQGVVQTADFLKLHDSFITGPQVSSLWLFLSSGISTSFVQYSENLSSSYNIFSSAYENVNVVPGLCTLAASTLECFSTIGISTPEVLNFLYNQYPLSSQYATQDLSTTYSQIAINLSSYTSSIAYYSTLSSIASAYSTQTTYDSQYVSSQNAPGGALDQELSTILQIPTQTLETVNPFLGSTLFFSSFSGISSYTLSNDGTIARSTFFDLIRTSTVYGDPSFNASLLGVQTNASHPFSLFLQGNLAVVTTGSGGGGSSPAPLPTVQLPNFQIYADNTLSPEASSISLQIYMSSIYFMSSVSLRQVPGSIQRGQLSLNTEPQNYALDLGFGDARKPAGSFWISPSDQRIKESIQNPDRTSLEHILESLRLVTFQYTSEYQALHGVASNPQLGFLSQEVKAVFPRAVSVDQRDGLDDFESLDMDQLSFVNFAITQSLLQRVSTLKSRICDILAK